MDIPEDVVTQILVRLPVKSLLRFRCVCKAWRDLIGSRRFMDMHLRHPSQGRDNEYLVLTRYDSEDQNNTVLSFYCRDGDLLQAAAPDWRLGMNVDSIGGPINGIWLVGTFEGWEDPFLYLCNPATRELRKIPDRPFGRQRVRPSKFHGYGAPFECKRVSAGLGYDPRTNDYKVVSIMLFVEDSYISGTSPYGPLKIEIYSVRSNSWRVADAVFPANFHPYPEPTPAPGMEDLHMYPLDFNYDSYGGEGGGMFEEFKCGLFLNGSIHWQSVGNDKAILAFNISDEVMLAFNLPRDVSRLQTYPSSLFVLDDSLAFVHRVSSEDGYYTPTNSFYVWVMVEYGDGESWIKRFYFQPEIHVDVLAFWNDMLICETTEYGEANEYGVICATKEYGVLVSCNVQDDAPHQFRMHHHITRCVPQLSNQQLLCGKMMGAMVMHTESLVRLR